MTALLQRAEAVLLWFIYHGFRLLPLDIASALGGGLARTLGPLLPPSKRAKRNLELALPDTDHDAIIKAMWDNLGRLAGEYPHSLEFTRDPSRLELIGGHYVRELKEKNQPVIFFSGHIGNWELTYALMAHLGVKGTGVFRAPDNPYLNWLFDRHVATGADLEMIPKGPVGARRSIEALSKGRSLVLFVDQKMNDGIEAPFFGRPAMTAPALATLALKYGTPVVPFRLVRIRGARFRAELLEPIVFTPTGDRNADQLRVMTEVNRILEGWIRENPAQWLWLHRRWPKELYRGRSKNG